MSLWREIRGAVRIDADPSTQVDPRAERVAAAAVGTLVLCGAVGTYLVIAGGLAPLFAATRHDQSHGPAPTAPPVTATSAPPSPSVRPAVSRTPTPAPSRTAAPPSAAVRPHTSTHVVPVVTRSDAGSPSPTVTPTPTPTPTPSVTPSPSASPAP
jgi:hypothetical protein